MCGWVVRVTFWRSGYYLTWVFEGSQNARYHGVMSNDRHTEQFLCSRQPKISEHTVCLSCLVSWKQLIHAFTFLKETGFDDAQSERTYPMSATPQNAVSWCAVIFLSGPKKSLCSREYAIASSAVLHGQHQVLRGHFYSRGVYSCVAKHGGEQVLEIRLWVPINWPQWLGKRHCSALNEEQIEKRNFSTSCSISGKQLLMIDTMDGQTELDELSGVGGQSIPFRSSSRGREGLGAPSTWTSFVPALEKRFERGP